MPDPMIRIQDLHKYFGDLEVLKGVDMDVTKGEVIVILGPSGSGNSTLMNIIGCLDRPSEGEYWLSGENVAELSDTQLARARNGKIGFVFQTFNLLPRATALQNVEVPLMYGGVGRRARRQKARESIDGTTRWNGLTLRLGPRLR